MEVIMVAAESEVVVVRLWLPGRFAHRNVAADGFVNLVDIFVWFVLVHCTSKFKTFLQDSRNVTFYER